MDSAPMKQLVRVGRKPHAVDTKKYGQPRVALYWAGRRFVKPGLYLWTGHRQRRVLPLPPDPKGRR